MTSSQDKDVPGNKLYQKSLNINLYVPMLVPGNGSANKRTDMDYLDTVMLRYCRQLCSWTVCHVSYRITGHGVRAFPVGHSTPIWRLLYIAHGSSRGLTGCSTGVTSIHSSTRTAWAWWQWWRSTGDSRRTLWFVWWTITRLWCPADTHKHQSGKSKYYNGRV